MTELLDPRKAFETELVNIALENKSVVAVSCDSCSGGGLSAFFKQFPERSVECGISEQNAVSICAAMSTQGLIPVLVAINPFLTMRAYEQIRDDIGYASTNVKLVGSGGGLAYSTLGSSHMAIEDIALMRTIPNLVILSPGDAYEVQAALDKAIELTGPVYIRMPRQAREFPKPCSQRKKVFGRAEWLFDGADAAILTYGPSTGEAVEAAKLLERKGIHVSVIDVMCLGPVDKESIIEASKRTVVAVLEEHIETGGLSTIVSEVFLKAGINKPIQLFTIPKGSKQTGPYHELLDYYGLSGQKVAERLEITLKSIRS